MKKFDIAEFFSLKLKENQFTPIEGRRIVWYIYTLAGNKINTIGTNFKTMDGVYYKSNNCNMMYKKKAQTRSYTGAERIENNVN